MKYNFLGIIKDEEFVDMAITDQEALLVEMYLLRPVHTLSKSLEHDERVIGRLNSRGGLNNDNLVYEPTDKLINEIYHFIISKYNPIISSRHLVFMREFNDDAFGRSLNEKRTLALDKFNSIYNQLCPNKTNISDDRFETLSYKKLTYQMRLARERALIYSYLMGKESVFDRELIQNTEVLKNILDFESYLKVLLDLNREFKFAEDTFFTLKSMSQKLFEAFEGKVEHLVTEFMTKHIEKIVLYPRAEITALYKYLRKKEIITITEKEMISVINDLYNYEFTRLRESDVANQEYSKRIAKIEKNWQQFVK